MRWKFWVRPTVKERLRKAVKEKDLKTISEIMEKYEWKIKEENSS